MNTFARKKWVKKVMVNMKHGVVMRKRSTGQRREGEFLSSFVSARKTPNIAKLAFSSHIAYYKTVSSKTKVRSI